MKQLYILKSSLPFFNRWYNSNCDIRLFIDADRYSAYFSDVFTFISVIPSVSVSIIF